MMATLDQTARAGEATARHPGRAEGAHGISRQGALAIIILNFNNREYLPACFDTLDAALRGIRHEIWFVDNCSSDGSPEYVRRRAPAAHVMVMERNGGFSYGNNRGLMDAGFGPDSSAGPPPFPYVMLLNPDTEVDPDALLRMLVYMDRHPDVGVTGPKMIRPNGELDTGCKRGEPTPATALYHMLGLARLFPQSPRFARYGMGYIDDDETAEVDSVMGACQMMRGTALRQVGLMDEETFFMYGEDLDFCIRFRRLGWRVVYLPTARVLHHKGAATRKTSGRMIREFHRAMAAFHRKHYAADTPWFVNGVIYGAIWLLGWIKFGLNRLRPPEERFVGSARHMSTG